MSAAGGDVGLFALEVLVEAVRVAAPSPALRPAVALRLLSFPTLLVHPAASAPLLRPGRPFPFGRGKRCLFRWLRGSLCSALRRHPLRALLLALPATLGPEPTRLLGSCSISLAPAAAEVLQRPEEPVRWGRRGRFPLKDASGRTVGELVLGFSLSSLKAGEQSGPDTPPHTSPAPEDEEEEEEEVDEEEERGEEDGNIICPPVLYYSHEPAESRLPPAAAMGHSDRIVVQSPQEQSKVQSPPHPSAGPSLLHPSSPQQLHSTLAQLPLLSALLAELSVLTRSATPAAVHPHLAWLYQAPGYCDTRPQPSSHSSAHKPAEVLVRPSGSSEATNSQLKQGQEQTTLTLPGSSQAGKRSKNAAHHGERESERNCTTKENTPPRRKLLYGLTNTLRLRLKQTNPDKLIHLERREQYRKKQVEMLKVRSPLSKRKLLKNAGEQCVVSHRLCSKGDHSKQNGEVDETVETSLQNAPLKEYFSSTDACPDLQKQAAESPLRNVFASKEHPCKATASSLLGKTILKSAHKEKDLKVQLPAAFTSDANVKGSNDNEETIHLIHHKIMEHDNSSVASDQKGSPSWTAGKSSEFIYSDDFFASPDNIVYSEDFTSAESTERDLEDLDSSPEPLWLESPNRPQSGTEEESSRSRVSKASERAESISDFVPVHSSSSPVSSLKRSHGLKNSKGTGGESADLLNNPSLWAGLLDEEQEAHQVDKEENRVEQHIKQASILRDEQVSSDTYLNIGKGQTSTEKTQSVTQVSSYLPSNLSNHELSDVENSRSSKNDDVLGDLHAPIQYKDISELVICNLPGYTV
ncbi:microtubule-associated protein 10 [Coturnix japonica]|uniref:microtubule-associated protein 10 n=1 Tax=Coturnix japonica TaxID=93934 RepID=UPI0013A5D8D7|nr:microtubule-associated protein 10 [Coturnix japonica]